MTTYIKNSDATQPVQSKLIRITDADLARQPNPLVYDIQLPAGAIVVGGHLNVQAASNDASTDVMDVGDAGSANRLANDLNLKTTGLKALTPTGYVMQGDATGAPKLRLTRVPANAGTSNALNMLVYVEFVVEGVACGNQG